MQLFFVRGQKQIYIYIYIYINLHWVTDYALVGKNIYRIIEIQLLLESAHKGCGCNEHPRGE